MLENKIYQSYFLGLLGLLAIGMSCSKFLISISVIGLGLGTLFLMFQKSFKWKDLRGYGLLLIVLYFMHILWILNSENLDYAINDFRRKLPLLVLPVVFMANKSLVKSHLNTILQLFAATSIVCSIVLLIRWFGFGYKNTDFRSFSDFISHIRFSICLVISFLILINNSLETKKFKLNAFLTIPIIWALLQMQSLSGFFLLATFTPLYLYWRKLVPKKLLIGYYSLAPVLVFGALFYHFQAKDSVPTHLPSHTTLGTPYEHYTDNTLCENNHRVYLFLAIPEMNQAWKDKTGLDANALMPNGYRYVDGLLRYLTSKGLPKDASGINALTPTDINNIKKGYTNYKQGQFSAISKRWNAIRFELDSYQNGYDIAGHSLTMRLEYVNVAWTCFVQNKWFGVGSGDVKDAISEEHTARDLLPVTYQKRAHNQIITYLMTFGLIGFLIILYIIVIYGFGTTQLNPLNRTIILLLFASLFWEDVMETQAGVTSFAFFYAILFAADGYDKTSAYTDSIPSTILVWLKSWARK